MHGWSNKLPTCSNALWLFAEWHLMALWCAWETNESHYITMVPNCSLKIFFRFWARNITPVYLPCCQTWSFQLNAYSFCNLFGNGVCCIITISPFLRSAIISTVSKQIPWTEQHLPNLYWQSVLHVTLGVLKPSPALHNTMVWWKWNQWQLGAMILLCHLSTCQENVLLFLNIVTKQLTIEVKFCWNISRTSCSTKRVSQRAFNSSITFSLSFYVLLLYVV
jgi:hypothetical protein